MVAKTIKRKKNTETVKEGLLNVLRESYTVEESNSNSQNIVDHREVIERIKHYDDIIKTRNKNTIRYESIQGQIFKKFKNSEGYAENVGLSRSTIYFKTGLYKFLKKYSALKNSSLSSHYFRNNFKIIKTVCKSNEELFA